MAGKLTCAVDVCDNEITEGTGSKGGLPICHRCRAAQYQLNKLSEGAIAEKKARWEYWEHRMDYLHPRVRAMVKDAKKRVTNAKRLAANA